MVYRSTPKPLSRFDGYSAKVIAEVCGISIGTAYNYKAGRAQPPVPTLRLFRLYRDGRIAGPEWGDYKLHQDKFFGAENRHVNAAHIAHLALVCETLAQIDPEGYQRFLEMQGLRVKGQYYPADT